MGIILITHYNKFLELFSPDQVSVIVDGKIVRQGGVELAQKIEEAVNAKAEETGGNFFCGRKGGLFTIFFSDKKSMTNLEDVKQCDTEMFSKYFNY